MLTDNPIVFSRSSRCWRRRFHYYLWARLVRATVRSGRGRLIGALTIAAVAAVAVLGFAVTRTVGVDTWWLAWPAYTWIALMFYLVLALFVLEIPRATLILWWRRRGERSARPAARTAVAEPSAGSTEGVSAGVSSGERAVATLRTAERPRPAAGESGGPGPADGTAGPTGPGRRLFLARGTFLQ